MGIFDLAALLKSYAEQPIPPFPKNLEDEVWRQIRNRSQNDREEFDLFTVTLANIRLLQAAFLTAVLVGFLSGSVFNQPAKEQLLARNSLHLEVFSSDSPELPSSLIWIR